MHLLRQSLLIAALGGAVWTAAAESPTSMPHVALAGLQKIALSGRLGHALREIDLHLERYPGDPHLLAMRANVLAALEETRGEPGPVRGGREPEPIARPAPEAGRDFTVPELEIAMLWVSPGTIVMSEIFESDNDTEVVLTHGFWLGRTEVTQEQWRFMMESEPSPGFFSGSQRPVERVTWSAAIAFCRILTERERAAGRLPEGYEYSLPLEAQWEFACRAGTTTPFAGDPEAMAWHNGNSNRRTHPVAQKQPNPWGFFDMHGNVWEWCLDGYAGYPGGRVVDPLPNHRGPAAVESRITRGGAWTATLAGCRSDHREWVALNYTTAAHGFRLALVRTQ